MIHADQSEKKVKITKIKRALLLLKIIAVIAL